MTTTSGDRRLSSRAERSAAQEPYAGCFEVPFADRHEHREVEFAWRRRRTSFNPHPARDGRRPHRGLHRHRDTSHAWCRREPIEDLFVEADACVGVAVLRARQADVDGDEIVRIEARIQRRETHEAREKQPGAHEQHLRDRQLARHEQHLRPPVSSGGRASHARLNGRVQRGARCTPRRPQAEAQSHERPSPEANAAMRPLTAISSTRGNPSGASCTSTLTPQAASARPRGRRTPREPRSRRAADGSRGRATPRARCASPIRPPVPSCARASDWRHSPRR